LTDFLKEVSTIRMASTTEIPHGHNRNPPVLIHCRGGERTGLVLVTDLLLYTLDHNQVRNFLHT
jgi:tyrosine-protein phosphatase non-receptor type 14/21